MKTFTGPPGDARPSEWSAVHPPKSHNGMQHEYPGHSSSSHRCQLLQCECSSVPANAPWSAKITVNYQSRAKLIHQIHAPHRMRKSTHYHTVPGQLAHVAAAEFPHLRCDAVLLHQRLFGKMELQGIIRGQGYTQTTSQILWQRIPVIVQEQRVVGQRRHGDSDLRQVVQILQDGHFAQEQSVTDVLGHQEATDEMLNGTCLTAMRTQYESVQSLFPGRRNG